MIMRIKKYSMKAWLSLAVLKAFALGTLFSLSLSAHAQEFVWAPDFTPGTPLPAFETQDQDGNVRTFDDLKGEKGMLFMLSRSFDW